MNADLSQGILEGQRFESDPKKFWSFAVQQRIRLTTPPNQDVITPRSVLEQVQLAVDREINAAAETLRALRSHKNSLHPICRIPEELLARISFFLSLTPYTCNHRKLHERPLRWHPFSGFLDEDT
ncbi:hypothetical protein OF83DRAFT_1172172 [Amylostereum chailletii]|nr:hypothetical protein OF83DRAFT_1172172 [Amylostereum chailletii]